jgi:hypothetical protein
MALVNPQNVRKWFLDQEIKKKFRVLNVGTSDDPPLQISDLNFKNRFEEIADH